MKVETRTKILQWWALLWQASLWVLLFGVLRMNGCASGPVDPVHHRLEPAEGYQRTGSDW